MAKEHRRDPVRERTSGGRHEAWKRSELHQRQYCEAGGPLQGLRELACAHHDLRDGRAIR
jgi:hypothetical protein